MFTRSFGSVKAPLNSSFRVLARCMSTKPIKLPKGPRPTIDHLLESNKKWADRMKTADPKFFSRLANYQKPKYLWIGCSDSRVPANEILGLAPGEVFVHRNVANLVVNTDMNMLSVLQFAVEYLEVEHILVTGHYDCGGVRAALQPKAMGLIDNWLRNVRDVARLYKDELMAITDPTERSRRLVELNVREQAMNVFKTGIVQQRHVITKKFGRAYPRVHALVYSVGDGILKELEMDEPAMFQKYSGIYNLFPESNKPEPKPQRNETSSSSSSDDEKTTYKTDCGANNHGKGCGCPH